MYESLYRLKEDWNLILLMIVMILDDLALSKEIYLIIQNEYKRQPTRHMLSKQRHINISAMSQDTLILKQDTIILALVLVQSRMNHPDITEKFVDWT